MRSWIAKTLTLASWGGRPGDIDATTLEALAISILMYGVAASVLFASACRVYGRVVDRPARKP